MAETLGAFASFLVITVGPSKVDLFDKLKLSKTFLVCSDYLCSPVMRCCYHCDHTVANTQRPKYQHNNL